MFVLILLIPFELRIFKNIFAHVSIFSTSAGMTGRICEILIKYLVPFKKWLFDVRKNKIFFTRIDFILAFPFLTATDEVSILRPNFVLANISILSL